MKKSAVIVAGGTGTRMGTDLPKQFLPLGGIPILVHTLRRFQSFDSRMQLVVVMHPDNLGAWKEICQSHFPAEALSRISTCAGGRQRTESVYNGLRELSRLRDPATPYLVAIHDAVRPFISNAMLQEAYDTAERTGASVCCVPVKSSLRERVGMGSRAVDREQFYHVQTPQTFHLTPLLEAYHNRPHDRFTDDASLFEAAGNPIQICQGSYDNIKVTTPEDMYVAEAILDRI